MRRINLEKLRGHVVNNNAGSGCRDSVCVCLLVLGTVKEWKREREKGELHWCWKRWFQILLQYNLCPLTFCVCKIKIKHV